VRPQPMPRRSAVTLGPPAPLSSNRQPPPPNGCRSRWSVTSSP
jgi:hypothetical protein